MEVLNISLEQNEFIRVKSPIISTNCLGRETSQGVNLTGSPFFFSETMNSFIAAGCNNKAFMTGVEPNIVGCESACVGGVLFGPNNTCNGYTCCETVIPTYLYLFNATFENKEPDPDLGGCKLAFIAEEKWFQHNLKTESSALQNMDYVEAVLDWAVPNNAFYLHEKDLYSTEYRCTIYRSLDIDECQDDPKRRCGDATCVNRPGHYVCEKAKTWIIILGT
ncbi:Wall-associated kinase [Corchorus olitorius]|uniref:Wall-associated kinase n=1 Tax=Corchorus olitorius TaxID=93759 RepID=A0A1R3HUJ8_9ROSI|nr:Wall-associated kinase [Corchorus olitorius]